MVITELYYNNTYKVSLNSGYTGNIIKYISLPPQIKHVFFFRKMKEMDKFFSEDVKGGHIER